jgi:hypothetical protein
MQPSSEEGENVLGGEVEHGIVEQMRVEGREIGAALEDQVGGVFGLVHDPVVVEVLEHVAQQRQDTMGEAAQAPGPVLAFEAICQRLGAPGILQFGEDVPLLDEVEPGAAHLTGQLRHASRRPWLL